jgi:hypothetical protein
MDPASAAPVVGAAQWQVKRSLRGRWRGVASDVAAATSMIVVGTGYLTGAVLLIYLNRDDTLANLFLVAVGACPGGILMVCYGTVRARAASSTLRRREDRIWFDETGLWWMRRRPARRGAEPRRVDLSHITQVRLGDGDGSVVLSTVDGVDHVLTDLGTAAQRSTLALAIGDHVRPGVARVHPVLPPTLPPGWRITPSDDAWLLWRRITGWRTWGLAALTYFAAAAGAGQVALASGSWRALVQLLVVVGIGALIARVAYEARRTRPGWLVRAGRLDAVRVRARTGRRVGALGRVITLDLAVPPTPGAAPSQLTALLDREQRPRVLTHRNPHLVAGFAEWLADRADLPLARRPTDSRQAKDG